MLPLLDCSSHELSFASLADPADPMDLPMDLELPIFSNLRSTRSHKSEAVASFATLKAADDACVALVRAGAWMFTRMKEAWGEGGTTPVAEEDIGLTGGGKDD